MATKNLDFEVISNNKKLSENRFSFIWRSLWQVFDKPCTNSWDDEENIRQLIRMGYHGN